MTTVTFCTGTRLGDVYDRQAVVPAAKSGNELMKDALLWAAGRFPESGEEYDAAVWIEDESGDVLDREIVTITAGGEMDFPG